MTSENPSSSSTSWSVIKVLDENVRYIQYPFYAVGLVGLWVVGRSLKMGKKFVLVESIPREFFKKNFTLYGKVEEVKKFDGSEQSIVLFIDHTPIFHKLPWRRRRVEQSSLKDSLEVVVPGIMLKASYFPEAHKKLMSQRVSFTLLDMNESKSSLYALVHVRGAWFRRFSRWENVGFWVSKNGYGAVSAIPHDSQLRQSKVFGKYYDKLLKLEKRAASKQIGIWKREEDENAGRGWFFKIVKYITQKFKNALKR